MSGMNFNKIKEKIEQKLNRINHSYIKSNIGNPKIDEDQLIFLTSLIGNQPSLSIIEKERYIITAMLIQIALDTHEQVPISFDQHMDDTTKAKNQLRVLAGDYYSGHYYSLLAEINKIELISILASAIKNINENKMTLYYLENPSLEESVYIANNIDVSLFIHLAKYINDESLNELVKEWFLIKRLIQEKANIQNGVDSIFLSKYDRVDILEQMDMFINKRKPSLQMLLNRLSEEHAELKFYIYNKSQNLIGKNKTSIAEEG